MNPRAGAAGKAEGFLRDLSGRFGPACRWTAAPGQARDLARKAAAEGCRRIVAVGGDGTVHEVANGVMDAGGRAAVGIIPLGTGNDLSRTLGIPQAPEDALDATLDGEARPMDLIQIETDAGEVHYGVNAAAGGFSGQVCERTEADWKAVWGPLAYIVGAAATIPEFQEYRTRIRADGGDETEVRAISVVVANGETVAAGHRVAPGADPADGLLDLVVMRSGSVIELARAGAGLLAGDFPSSPLVSHRRVREVRLVSQPGMWFSVDGEVHPPAPRTFRAAGSALRVLRPPAQAAH